MMTMRVIEAVKIVLTVMVTLRDKKKIVPACVKLTNKHKIKKEIVSACVKLAVWEFFKYEEKQH